MTREQATLIASKLSYDEKLKLCRIFSEIIASRT